MRNAVSRTVLIVALLTGCASTAAPEWRSIHVLRPGGDVTGCAFRGLAQDDDMEDLLKRARKIDGDTVVMTDRMRGKDFVGEVYRCKAK